MRYLIALLVVLMWPTLARADESYGVVTLDLQPAAGGVPTHLCVVSEAKSPRTRKKLWDVLAVEPYSKTAGRGTSWLVKPEVWGGDEASADAQRCAEDPIGDCRPRVELPEGLSRQGQLHIACTDDKLTEGGLTTEPRPLFILLEYLEGSPPQIESVRLAGGVATIGVLGANFDHVIVTARSLGGAYVAHGRSERAAVEGSSDNGEKGPRAKHVRLDLTPRCQSIQVRVPRTRVKPADRDRMAVRVHGIQVDVDKCVGGLTGTDVVQVRMPQAPQGVGRVDIELKATPTKAAARFGGTFEGQWPKAPFRLDLNQITFSWRRPRCIYPEDRCPTATLETGTRCTAEVTKTGCAYRCPGEVTDEGVLDLTLPLEVTFEKTDPGQRWTDKLAQNGQELNSFVPPQETYLGTTISNWERDIPDNEIEKVEIYGEDGAAREFGVANLDVLELKVPGASCESVRYRPIGDRHYEENVALVTNGKLDFGRYQDTARIVSFNVTLLVGGGPAWSSIPEAVDTGVENNAPLFFNALAMFAVQVRPRYRVRRLAFEGRFGGTLGRWSTRLVDVDPTTGGPDEETLEDRQFGWARILFEPAMVFSAHKRIALATGFGLGFSLPVRQSTEISGDRLRFVYSPNIDARFKLRRWLRFVIQFRGVFNERAFYSDDQTPSGDPERATARSLLVLLGLQASF